MGKKKLFACFVDFKKPLDSVWHEGLFFKLNKIGICGKQTSATNRRYIPKN